MGIRYSEVFIEQAPTVKNRMGVSITVRRVMKTASRVEPLLSLSLNEQVLLYMRLTQPLSLWHHFALR